MKKNLKIDKVLLLTKYIAAVSVALPVSGCSGELLVGDEKSASDGAALEVALWEPPPDYEGEGECADMDSAVRNGYETWRRTTNDFAELRGSQWEGKLKGQGDELNVFLNIAADGSASIVFGDREATHPPLEADKGPFCGDMFKDTTGFVECETGTDGLPYEVHGASFQEGVLLLPFNEKSPWDDWCALQAPQEWEVDGCRYEPTANFSTQLDQESGTCWVGGEDTMKDGVEVDCGWLMLLDRDPYCSCASDGCFVADTLGENANFDLSLSTDGRTLSGTAYGNYWDQVEVELSRLD